MTVKKHQPNIHPAACYGSERKVDIWLMFVEKYGEIDYNDTTAKTRGCFCYVFLYLFMFLAGSYYLIKEACGITGRY